MKNVKKKLCMALSVAACLCAGVAVNANYAPKAAETVAVAAAETYSATDVKLIDGASIRLDKDMNGIRFGVYIGNEATKPYSATMKLGVLIIPEACLADGEELKYGVATSKGYNAKVVEFDGVEERLATGEGDYANGKLFNAVLNLTDKGANYINNKYVARAYVLNTETGEVDHYVGDQISRAPAFVAAEAREVDTVDTENVLLDYLQYVEITANDVNVKKGDNYKNASTNVEGIKISYSGIVEGTVTASVGKGAVTKEFGVAELQDQRTFYSSFYTPDDDFKFAAYDVNEVQLDGVALADEAWAYANGELTVKKSAVLSGEGALKVISATAGDVEVAAKAYKAAFTSFHADQLGAEILGDCEENFTVTANTSTHSLTLTAKDLTRRMSVNLHTDYVKAMFANPNLHSLSFGVAANNVDGSEGFGYPTIAPSGEGVKIQAQYTSCTPGTGRSVGVDRSNYVFMRETNDFQTLAVWINEGKLNEGASFTFNYVTALSDDNATTAPKLYADAQLIGQRGLSYTLPSVETGTGLGSVKVNGSDKTTLTTKNGAYVNVAAAGVNSALLEAKSFDITSNGNAGGNWDRVRTFITTKAMIDDNQYISVDKVEGDTVTYPFVLEDADHKIFRVSLNGNEITTYDENGNITVNKADLEYGHNALEVNVEHTYLSGSIYKTVCKTYYRSLCAVTQTDWDSALTFEMGMNPFVSFIGSGTVEVIDSATAINELESTYAYATTAPYANGTINNNKVLKITGSTVANSTTTMYVYSKYYVGRRAAAATAGGAEACQKVAAFGSGYMRWTAATLDDVVTDSGDTSGTQPKASLEQAKENRNIFAGADTIYNAIYNAETGEIIEGQDSFKIIFASANKTGYFDDIFAATTSVYHAKSQNQYSLLGTYDYWNA